MAASVQREIATGAAPPVSRRARKKERTRQEIYSAAMKLFLRRGFEEVTKEQAHKRSTW